VISVNAHKVFDVRSQRSLLWLNWVSGGGGVTTLEHHHIHLLLSAHHHPSPRIRVVYNCVSVSFKSFITAPLKPSKQTQILLDNMSKNTEEEKTRWDQVMEHFDLLFTRVNDIGEVQQQMKTQMDIRGQAMDNYTAEQQLIAQQVKANGAAVAQLTMRQFDNDGPF